MTYFRASSGNYNTPHICRPGTIERRVSEESPIRGLYVMLTDPSIRNNDLYRCECGRWWIAYQGPPDKGLILKWYSVSERRAQKIIKRENRSEA